jgi:hypothetical protein
VQKESAMADDSKAKPIELRCHPCEGGFEVSIFAAPGLSFWLEYYVLGGGGYRESGEITGRITGEPETIFRRVAVPVIEVGIAGFSLGPPRQLRARSLDSRKPTALDRRPIPDGAIEILAGEAGDEATSADKQE